MIFNEKIINEIPMNFDFILYNDMGNKIYDGRIYKRELIEEKKENFFG